MAKSKKKSVKPLGAFVLVKRNEAESTTQGGIIIPDSSQEKPLEATVVSVGAGRMDHKGNVTPLTVKKGDKVINIASMPAKERGMTNMMKLSKIK